MNKFANAIISLDNIFDTPKNGIKTTFELVLSILEAQHEQNEKLRNDYQTFKDQHIHSMTLHKEQFQDQLTQLELNFDMKIKLLRDKWDANNIISHKNEKDEESVPDRIQHELNKLQEACKADVTAMNEINQRRFLQLEENTEELYAELEILQESLLGGTDGVPRSGRGAFIKRCLDHAIGSELKGTMKLPSIHNENDNVIDFNMCTEGMNQIYSKKGGNETETQETKLHSKATKTEDTDKNLNHPKGREMYPTCNEPLSDEVTLKKEHRRNDCDNYAIHSHVSQECTALCGTESSVIYLSTEPSHMNDYKDLKLDEKLNDDASRPPLDDISCNSTMQGQDRNNVVTLYNSSARSSTGSSNDEIQQVKLISSNSVELISTIYESVRLRRLSKTTQHKPSLETNAYGVIIHLLDQAKVFEQDIQSICARIDNLTYTLHTLTGAVPASNSHQSNYDEQHDEKKEIFENFDHETGEKPIVDFAVRLSQISADVSNCVPQNHLRQLINTMYFSLTNNETSLAQSDEDIAKEIIHELKRRQIESNQMQNNHLENIVQNVKDSLWDMLYTELSSRDEWMKESINSIRHLLPSSANGKTEATTHGASLVYVDCPDIDAKIQLATENVQNSMRELISFHLGHLSLVENEVAKLTLQLAERPDDAQINKMIHDLDQIVSDRIGKTEVSQSILESMKQGKQSILMDL
jgi:hypothetical protein